MYMRLFLRDRNGLLFIHATTLCMLQLRFRNTAVQDRYQPYAGGFGNIKVPCGIPNISSTKMSLCSRTPRRMFAIVIPWGVASDYVLCQNLRRVRHTSHDDQRPNHISLRPWFQSNRGRFSWLHLGGPFIDTHFESYSLQAYAASVVKALWCATKRQML